MVIAFNATYMNFSSIQTNLHGIFFSIDFMTQKCSRIIYIFY
jgi:hypothetical protein